MSLLRATHSPTSSPSYASSRPALRVLASGTLFLTHRLCVSSYPEAGGVARAQNVQRNRGGHGANVLAVLAQFRASRQHLSPNGSVVVVSGGASARNVGDVQFCGPLAGTEEGMLVIKELEAQGVGMIFSIVRDGKGVPSAWVIETGDGMKTVMRAAHPSIQQSQTFSFHSNHNPLPDMTHDEFVSHLGPVLAPENYDIPSSPPPSHALPTPTSASSPHSHTRKRSGSGHQTYGSPPNGHAYSPYNQSLNPGMPPFDWMHFEGRAPQTTLANLTGLDGLARERRWRTQCVFSLEVARAGVEMLIQHVDVIFFSKPYAQAVSSPHTPLSPRSFLISMSAHAAPHALLVVDWGAQGAALLSVPTREYLQSSGWVEPACNVVKPQWNNNGTGGGLGGTVDPLALGSVRTGSGFWADGRPRSDLTVAESERSQWTGNGVPPTPAEEQSHSQLRSSPAASEGDPDSRRTSIETERGAEPNLVDEVGAHEAFVAGMMFALSQRILPGHPYTLNDTTRTHATVAGGGGGGGADVLPGGSGGGGGKWRLEECLRFATELAGRKGRRMDFGGLRVEMERAGWVVE